MSGPVATPLEETADPVLVEAADWLVRLTSGEMTDEDVGALAQWRATSASHDDAFRWLAGLSGAARTLKRERVGARRREVLMGCIGLTAAAAAGVEHPPYGLWPSLAELTADRRTGAGQRQTFSPSGGVQVDMNSRTSLSLRDRGAGVQLIRGEAFVSVARAARPFFVATAPARISARAGRFDVQMLEGRLQVACAEGEVLCEHGARRTTLGSGQALVVEPGGRATVTAANPQAAAWLQGMLVFNGEPLEDVVAQINLYRRGRIILTNAAIARRPVVGVFHTAQIDNAVGQIQQLLGLNLRRLPGDVVLLG
jgi:transmembrane sensor